MTRRSAQELSGWGSLQKTAYILLPLLFYFLAQDLSWMLLGMALEGSWVNGVSVLAGAALIQRGLREEITGAFKEKETTAVKGAAAYALLAGLAVCASWGMNFALYFLQITGSYRETAAAQYGGALWAGLILYGFLTPVVEEAIFRGLVYNRLKRCFGFRQALLVSSFLFGCYHGNLVQGIYGTVMGLLMAWCYERYGSMKAPVLIHGTANASVYLMTRMGGFSWLAKVWEKEGFPNAGVFLWAVFFLAGAAICIKCVNKLIKKQTISN